MPSQRGLVSEPAPAGTVVAEPGEIPLGETIQGDSGLIPLPVASASGMHQRALRLMGTDFRLTVIEGDSAKAAEALDTALFEIRRIEALISSWDSSSQTSLVNRMAGRGPVEVDRELASLTARALKVSELSAGAFDPTFGALGALWQIEQGATSIPDTAAIEAALQLVGWENLELTMPPDDQPDTASSLFLAREGMQLGFGAIGKGYAADRAASILKERGIQHGVVNAAGDLLTWGAGPDGTPWTVGIADPARPEELFAWLEISGMAVVTSGNYIRYVEIGDTRYGHIIDPRSGWPAQGLSSATVICPIAELADALATAVIVLGETEGMALLESLQGIEGILISDQGVVQSSSGLTLNMYGRDGAGQAPQVITRIGGEAVEGGDTHD